MMMFLLKIMGKVVEDFWKAIGTHPAGEGERPRLGSEINIVYPSLFLNLGY